MILLGLYTAWRVVHSEYYLKGDPEGSSTGTVDATAGTCLLVAPAPNGSGSDDVESPPAEQSPEPACRGARAARCLLGLKERLLATVVGTIHGVAGAFCLSSFFW